MTTFKRFLTLFLIATLSIATWGANYSETIGYSTLSSMLSGNYTDASSYWKVPGTAGNSATITVPASYFTNQPTSDVTITFNIATFGGGTNPSSSNTTITAVGTEASSTWSGSTVSTYPSSSTYVNGVMTLTKAATPTTLGGLTITMGVNTGVKIFRLQSIKIEYTYSDAPYTVTLSKNGSTTDITGRTGTYTLPTTGEHVADACTGWSWHCWTNAPYAPSTPSTTAPSTTKITTMTAAGTAYAVYKHTETSGGSSTSTFVAASQGWGDSENADTKNIDNVTYSFAQNTGTNPPKYYNSGTSVRFYQNNSLTISSSSTITAIEFSYSQSEFVQASVSTGTVTDGNWSGSATSVTFTNKNSTQVRVSQIVVTMGGGSTTTYTSSPDCAECMNKVTLTKGTPEHGSFSLNKADGAYDNCAAGGLVVTVSGITPADGYQFKEITQTGIASGVTINQTSKTVTYAKDVTGASTINVVFETIPTYTVTLNKNGSTSDITGCTGTYTLPTTGEHVANACEGWAWHCWTDAAYSTGSPTSTAPSSTVITTMSSAGTAYAVYKHEETSGGSSNVTFTAGTDQGSTTNTSSDAMTKGGITISSTSAAFAYDDNYRFYSGGTITISSSGENITSIIFNSTASGTASNGPGNISGTGYSYSGKVGTWTGNAASVSLSTTAQSRATSIVVTTGGGSTTTYTSSPDCTPCDYKVTLTKGEESHGTFTLDKTNGVYNNCTSNFLVTVSGISPVSGYYCTGVTATGDHNEVTGPDGSGNYTVTYAKGNNITSEVTANFAPNPKYTVTWYMNGDETNQDSYEEGEDIVFPGSADGCDGKVFRGWSADPVAETDVEPTYVTSATMPAHAVTYYAVYAEASTGSGTPTTETYGFEDADDDTNWTIDAAITKSSSAKATGTYGGIINTDETYITFNNKVKVTNFSFKLARTSKNSNYYVNIETSTDGSVWTEAESYEMSSFSNGSFTPKSKDFDGNTELYVRLFCYNTTAVRYIDDISITYGGGTTYSGYTTTCGAGISAQNIGWITSAAGQKVKRVINVSAKNFEDDVTLAATCANSHFALTLGATDVPAGAGGLTTTLTVEYTPTAPGKEENVEIVLTAGDKSRTITVNGRCVPDEFLLITKKSSTWYALPANMATSGEHDGIEVSPNDLTTPTVVPVSPSNAIYSLASVANSRYADNGHCVRLVGNDNLCLWSNMASTTGKTNIQNKTQAATAATDNHDWLLTTTDGIRYTIANPHHPHYGDGRILAFGTKFGMYIEDTEFFIVSAGCSSQPGDVTVSPRRVEATFSWVSNTTQMHIDLYTNELMTEGHLQATASSSPYVFSGLAESTDYWYKLTPGTDVDCAVTGTFKTTGPLIDIVEWQENDVVLFIDKGDINPKIVIDGQEEHGSITGGGNATELFFAKYFEGAGSMKLLSIFNGTKNDISLSNYKFYDRHAGDGDTSYGSDSEYDLSSLGSIKAGQEIIFFSRPLGTEPVSGCSTSFLNAVATKNTPEDNPRWIECASGKFANKAITINGNDAILLTKSGTIIDVIGALNAPGQGSNCSSEDAWEGTIKNMDKGKSPSDPVFDAFYEASSKSPVTTADSIALLAGFGINLSADEIDIPTARCIFFRDKRVQNGDSAVALNTDDFVTFTNHIESGTNYKAEWYGRSVCMTKAMRTAAGVANDAQATCNSYQDIANMDYNQYYIDWHNIDPGQELSTFSSDPETKEYTIPITNMRQYACLNLRFQLVHEGNVLTEAAQQVPIVVVGDVNTNDPLFSELVEDKTTHEKLYPQSLARCADCDVVVLGSASLTKLSGTSEELVAAHDVAEVGNVKVYPGGKLVVPSGTEYTMKSLALRRQEDVVASADVQGTITFKAPAASPAPMHREAEADDAQRAKKTEPAPKQTYFDLRIDPTNWHYISLPYDVNVADIRFANPEETAIPALGTDYLLKWYDGEKRAATQAGGCWEMVAPDATLKKGLGYIFSLPGDGKVKREFRFPMSNDVITEDHSNKEVGIIYGYGCDKSMTEVRANHRGWNLIGNPFLMPYSSDITNPLLTGKIVEDHSTDPWDGHFMFEDNPLTNLHYIVEPVDNGWSEYRQVAIADYQMTPFTSYFVQIGGSAPTDPQAIQFKASRVQRSSIVSRRPAEYEDVEDTHPVWCAIDLTNSNAETDETTLLISDDFTDGYDIMNDLVKMRGTYYQYTQITTRPVLASRNNEGEMAFNALPDSSAVAGVPLNFFTAYSGSYTIAYNDKFDRDNEVKAVMLLDKTTNQWYDLMNEPYEFTTNRTDDKTRFILSVRVERKKPQTPTDIINPSDSGGDGTTPRKLLINGHVYILRGGVIYDMTGKPMLNL